MVSPYCLVILLHEHGYLHILFSKPSVIFLSLLFHSCPLILDDIACCFTRKRGLSGRSSLNFSFFLSAAYILIYSCNHSSSLSKFLFFLFQQVLLHLGAFAHDFFSEMKAPLQLCSFSSYSPVRCHPFVETYPDPLKQWRPCPLCALIPLSIFLY